jgi:hypothetical protein
MRNRRLSVLVVGLLIVPLVTLAQAQPPDSNDVLGFETTTGWTMAASATPGTVVVLTPQRTQGSAAFAVANPSNLIKLISQPVSSAAAALLGIGELGGQFRLDVLVPSQQGNQNNAGYIQLYVTSPSRGLSKVAVAQVTLNSVAAGTYSTLGFPIPAAVRNALSASFNDLTFEFNISSPGKITGTYLLDNLRVHSLPTESDEPPPGYGSSVDLLVKGDVPDAKSFDAGAVQVPGDFTFILPTDTSASRLQLDLGHDGTSSFTCLYDLDQADATNKHFVLASCSHGNQAGDLVGASWARLAILNGNGTGKIRAQLALNPVGDLLGRGIIPPMPTFWGDFGNCTPAPASAPTATPVTLSESCATQAAQASQIVATYFDQVTISLDEVVTPTPLYAQRLGDGRPHDNLTGPPPANDPPFDFSGHMNEGGDWDAYWRLNGNLEAYGINETDRGITHFESDLGANAVIWGYDVNVMTVRAVLDTDTGQTYPSAIPPKAIGTLEMYVFGSLLKSHSADGSTGFNVSETEENVQTIAVIPIWIFNITLKAGYVLGLTATGGISEDGPSFAVTPSAALDAHVSGGVSIGVASGSVNAKVNLITVETPVKINANFTANADPTVCANKLTYTLDGQVKFSSGGGKVSLKAKFGACPFCYTKSWKLFGWDPLFTTEWALFNHQDTQYFMLPTAQCAATPLVVSIAAPKPNATVPVNYPYHLSGSAQGPLGSIVPCSGLSWSFIPGANASPAGVSPNSASGVCGFDATFAPPLSGPSAAWTVKLNASHTYTDMFARSITKTGSRSVPFTVTTLPTGVYILSLVDTDFADAVYTIGPGEHTVLVLNGLSSIPMTRHFLVSGLVSGVTGISSFSATNGTVSTFGGTATSSTPQAAWDLTTIPFTDGSGITTYFFPDTVITLTTTTSGGQTYTTDLNVQFVVIK